MLTRNLFLLILLFPSFCSAGESSSDEICEVARASHELSDVTILSLRFLTLVELNVQIDCFADNSTAQLKPKITGPFLALFPEIESIAAIGKGNPPNIDLSIDSYPNDITGEVEPEILVSASNLKNGYHYLLSIRWSERAVKDPLFGNDLANFFVTLDESKFDVTSHTWTRLRFREPLKLDWKRSYAIFQGQRVSLEEQTSQR